MKKRYIAGAVMLVLILTGLSLFTGCGNLQSPANDPKTDLEFWPDGSAWGPPGWKLMAPTPLAGVSHSSGLVMGDIKVLRATAKRVLRAPQDWDCPDALDSSPYCTPLKYQGQDPWCAAYSIEQLLSASWWRTYHAKHNFPVGAIYAAARKIDGLPRGTQGTTLDAAISAVGFADLGVTNTPTTLREFIMDADDIFFAVHKYGLVIVGLNITSGWNRDRLNMDGSIGPASDDAGGHAVLVSGYSKKLGKIWGPNWWGDAWGRNGWWVMTIPQFEKQFGYGYGVRIIWPDAAAIE
jgi:hypothetical protein